MFRERPAASGARLSTTPGVAIVAATTSGSSVSLACPWWKKLLPAPRLKRRLHREGGDREKIMNAIDDYVEEMTDDRTKLHAGSSSIG